MSHEFLVLDINQAYALFTCCGFMTLRSNAELQRRQCPVCSINYPVVARANQGCPMWAINAEDLRLSDQGVQFTSDDFTGVLHMTDHWLRRCNEIRPHDTLRSLSPARYRAQAFETITTLV